MIDTNRRRPARPGDLARQRAGSDGPDEPSHDVRRLRHDEKRPCLDEAPIRLTKEPGL